MVKLYLDYFPHSKMAISEHKNGHFEEIRGWLQILELVSNSTIFHLLFDTYDSPGAVFIWKWEKYRPYLLVWIVRRIPLTFTLSIWYEGNSVPGTVWNMNFCISPTKKRKNSFSAKLWPRQYLFPIPNGITFSSGTKCPWSRNL